MRVLVFSHEFPPALGGAGIVARDYALQLSREGHLVDVLTCNKSSTSIYDDKQGDNGFDLYQANVKGKFWFLSYRNAVDFSIYDYIILNDPGSIYTAGLFFSKEILSKSICFLHGSEPELIYVKPSVLRRLTFFKFFYRRALKESIRVVAVSEFMKNKFFRVESNYDIRNKVKVVRNSVDPDLFHPTPRGVLKEKFDLPLDCKILFSASRLIKEKGYDDLLQYFQTLLKQDLRWHWVIAGDGDYFNVLKDKVTAMGLEHSIHFLGSVARERLKYYYSSADIFCLLSRMDESFGLVYEEARSCGCPSIAREQLGVREAIIEGISGTLVSSENEFLDAICYFSSEHFSREKMLLHSRQQNYLLFDELFL
ncbi:glycosyltransferase family 4 protein [Vibrio fluvialis]|nr:glycosyltransferase family 4 protein [Vibrio fluvialis]